MSMSPYALPTIPQIDRGRAEQLAGMRAAMSETLALYTATTIPVNLENGGSKSEIISQIRDLAYGLDYYPMEASDRESLKQRIMDVLWAIDPYEAHA